VWAIAIPWLIAATASATAPIAVNSFDDEVDANPGDGVCLSASGHCTLRAAVRTANSLDGYNIIQLEAGTYTLTLTSEGSLVSSGDLRINGVPGTVIEGDTGWSHQILVTTDGDLEIFQVVIRNGFADYGGCVEAKWGDLELILVEISDCTAEHNGGAIRPGPGYALTIDRSWIHDNDAVRGAGIAMTNPNPAIITDSTISSNLADYLGGGVHVNGGTTFINNTTLYANASVDYGGGLYIADGQVMLSSSTIVTNFCDLEAGSTVLYGCGIDASSTADVHVRNTIIAKNLNWNSGTPVNEPDDCKGAFVSHGYNLIGFSERCDGFSLANNDLVGDPIIEPLLGPFGNNGGPTPTLLPKIGSPVLDAGNPGGCTEDVDGDWLTPPTLTTDDQRGFPRTVDSDGDGSAICDIGSTEASLSSTIFSDGFESGDVLLWSSASGEE
jgi:CSLREA domain-containing protein